MTTVQPSLIRRSKGHMFKSIDYTFTYYQGCGTPGTLREGRPACLYCWTQFMPFGAISREPKLMWKDPSAKLPDKIRNCTIFLNSAHDTFAPVIPTEWINDMIYWMSHQDPSVIFYLQSKWINRARECADALEQIKDRIILGTTLETDNQLVLHDIGSKAPAVRTRTIALHEFASKGFRTRLSLEPLFKFNADGMMQFIKLTMPEIIEIGLDNYQEKHGLTIEQPSKISILYLLTRIDQETTAQVYKKSSLKAYLKETSK